MPPRVVKERRYVDVIQRVDSLGNVFPLAICWLDGRLFNIDAARVTSATRSSEFNHNDIEAYTV